MSMLITCYGYEGYLLGKNSLQSFWQRSYPKAFKLTCIDPKLDLTIQDEVKLIKEKFAHETFDLSPYGYVIAQEPCDATEHIIRA